MKSAVETRTSHSVWGSGLLDRVDYRLVETAEERDRICSLRYRAYLNGGLIPPSEAQRVYDPYDDAPNAWTLGIYVDGELCSSVRLHVLTPEWRMSHATELFGDVLHPRLDRGEVFVDPSRLAADPEKARRFPELPYLTVRLGYMACEYFNADTGLALVRAEHQAFYRRVFLQETIAEPRPIPIVRFPGRAGKGLDPFSHHAFDVRRAADAVPARRRATFAATRGCHLLRAPLDRSELAGRTSRRTPEPPWLGGFRPHRPDIRARLLSPSRHIYKPLTIAFAFPRLLAFGRFWQHLIKVDGTFA